MRRMFFACLAAVLAAFGTEASAAIVTYTNQASFDTATSGTPFVLEDFSGATPGGLAKGTAHSFNGFTASAVDAGGSNMSFYIAPNPFAGAEHAPFTRSQHLGWAEDSPFFNGSGTFGPTVTLTFNQPQSAVSFLFLDSDGTDEYRLLVDGSEVLSFPSRVSGFDNDTFFGIVDTTGTFSTLTFTTTGTNPGGFVEEFGIDDVRSAGVIPEPASGTMWSVLALGFVALRRRAK